MSASDICRAKRLYAPRRSAYRAASGSGPSCPFSLNARMPERSFSSTSVMRCASDGAAFHSHAAPPRQEPGSPLRLGRTLAEDGRADANDGCPLLDRRLVVGAHPHRQLRQRRRSAQLVAQLAEAPEVLSRVVLGGRDAHEPFAAEREKAANRVHEWTELARRD